MRFMILVLPGDRKAYEAGEMPAAELVDEMMKYNTELVQAGVMLDGGGLHPPARGARLSFAKGDRKGVTDGPYAEARELVGGYWLWQCKSIEEAVQWARRAPMEDGAVLEIRQLFDPEDFGPEIASKERDLIAIVEKRQNT